MTFTEALKTGKALRRSGWDFWWSPNGCYYIGIHDALAEDWEVGERTVEIGVEQFRAACTKAQEMVIYEYTKKGRTNLYDEFTKYLSEALRFQS